MATTTAQKKMMADRGYISIWDAALATGQNYSTIYRYMQNNERAIPRTRLGKRWYLDAQALIAHYRKQDKKSPYIKIVQQALANLKTLEAA